MSTQATLLGRLQTDLKIDPNNRIWSEDTKKQAISDSYTFIQGEGGYWRPENQTSTTVTTVSGTQEYTIASDFRVSEIVIYNNIKLKKTSKAYVEVVQTTTDSGKPSRYYLYGNKLGIYPKPDGAYTITVLYGKALPTITSSVDSEFPADMDSTISTYAAYLLNLQIPNRAAIALGYLERYEQLIASNKLAYLFQDFDNKFAYQRFGNNYRDDVLNDY